MSKLVEVAIGLLLRRSGAAREILIARRPAGSPLAGYWEFPGGKCEPTETLQQCVVREFEEELGVTIKAMHAIARIEHAYDHATVRLHAFLCEHVEGEPQALAVDEFRWVRVTDLPTYRFPPANASLLARLPELLEEQPTK